MYWADKASLIALPVQNALLPAVLKKRENTAFQAIFELSQ